MEGGSQKVEDLCKSGEVSCYVHEVTPVHIAGKLKYTTCQLQTSENATTKAICFSPEKAVPMKVAMESRSPIKIKRCEFNEKFNNVVINKKSLIIPLEEVLPFKGLESLDRKVTIKSLATTSPGQLVTIKGQVQTLSGVKSVKIEDCSLSKSTAILVDPTGSISAVFWGEWATSIEESKTYLMKNLRVKKDPFSKELYVNTAKEEFKLEEVTNFTENVVEATPSIVDMSTKDATILIHGVKYVSAYYTCTACGKKANIDGKMMKCGTCHLRQRVRPGAKHWYCRLFAEDETANKFYVAVFHQQLVKLFQQKDEKLTDELTEDNIADLQIFSLS